MFYLPKLLNLSEGFLLLEIPLFLTLYERKDHKKKATQKNRNNYGIITLYLTFKERPKVLQMSKYHYN